MVKRKGKKDDNVKSIKIKYEVDLRQLKEVEKLLRRIKKLIPKYDKLH